MALDSKGFFRSLIKRIQYEFSAGVKNPLKIFP